MTARAGRAGVGSGHGLRLAASPGAGAGSRGAACGRSFPRAEPRAAGGVGRRPAPLSAAVSASLRQAVTGCAGRPSCTALSWQCKEGVVRGYVV